MPSPRSWHLVVNSPAAPTLYGRALAIRRMTTGPDRPDVASTLSNLAQVTGAAGNTRLALQQVNERIRIYGSSGVTQEPDHLARAFALRGMLPYKTGRLFGRAQ